MTGPLCTRCQARPVRRAVGTRPPAGGWRLMDGVRWRWFCSRVCSNAARGGNLDPTSPARNTMRRRAFERTLARVKAECAAVVTPDGYVPIKAIVRAVMEEVRRARAKGATEQRKRDLRWVHARAEELARQAVSA